MTNSAPNVRFRPLVEHDGHRDYQRRDDDDQDNWRIEMPPFRRQEWIAFVPARFRRHGSPSLKHQLECKMAQAKGSAETTMVTFADAIDEPHRGVRSWARWPAQRDLAVCIIEAVGGPASS